MSQSHHNGPESMVRTQWMLGVLITLIPICIIIYFIFFWAPDRGSDEDQNPVVDSSASLVPPEQPPTGITPNFENTTIEKEVPQEKLDAYLNQPEERFQPLPPLDNSDDQVLDDLASLSPNVEWYIWLYTEQLVPKFVTVIDNLSTGTVASKYISIPNPSQSFQTLEKDGSLYLNPASFQRYNVYTDMFTSMDNADLIATYQHYLPLLDEAFSQLGYPQDVNFNDRMVDAIDKLLAAPVVENEIELELPDPVIFKFADPNLEDLSMVQKQLIRMGPRNTRLIQQKLASLKPLLQDLE